MTRDDYLKALRENETYKTILSRATSDAERRAISAYTEDFIVRLCASVIEPAMTSLPTDPNDRMKVFQEVSEVLIKSGSAEITKEK
jgi:hypothetical protein